VDTQRRVAFLPFVRTTLKSLIPKNYDFEPGTIGEHIKKRRLVLGLHQKEVAALFKVRTETVHNWEIGYTKPTIQLVPALISFLGYDPDPQNPVSVGEHLRSRRRQHGWTHKQAAMTFGVDPSTWLNWESGGTIMLSNHRKMIADFIGLPMSQVHLGMKKQWNDNHGKPTL
jgi:transcriptional regulator with XRE-family HTH domain